MQRRLLVPIAAFVALVASPSVDAAPPTAKKDTAKKAPVCRLAKKTITRGGGSVVSLEFRAEDDTCGILYWLGSEGRKTPFSNPARAGKVSVSASSLMRDSSPIDTLVGRGLVRLSSKPLPNSWMQVDFGRARVVAKRYTLRHYSSWDTEALRNWEFQASNDGASWTTLRKHTNDTTLKTKGARGSWTLTSKASKKSWRYFRVLQTGKNSNNHHYLALSGLEIYGDLLDQAGPRPGKFAPDAPFDRNGIVHYLGTQDGKTKFKNPGEGAVAVFASSVARDSSAPTELLARRTLRFTSTPRPDQWVAFDFLHRRVRPTHYSLRHYSSWDNEALRNWVLEASNDAKTWTALRTHINDKTLDKKGKAATWELPDAPAGESYRYFRVRMTGRNSNNHNYLALSGFEIYGDLDE